MASPAVGLIAPFLLLFLVVSMATHAWRLRRLDREIAVRKWRGANRGVGVLVWIPFPLLLGLAGLGVAVRRTTVDFAGLSSSHPLPYLAEAAALLAVAVPANVAVYTVGAAVAREYRDLDRSLPSTVGRATVGIAMLALFALVPVTVFVVPWLGTAALVASLLFVYLAWWLTWWTTRNLLHSVREPTAAERERLAAAFAGTGFEPQTTRVVNTAPEEKVNAALSGPAPWRSVVVTNYLLETADDEVLRAIAGNLAVADRLRAPERGIARVAGVFAAIAVALFLLQPPWSSAAVLACLLGFSLLQWHSRRVVYRMDEAAADLVGAEALLAAFTWRVERHGAPLDHSVLRTVFTGVPPRRERMRRLIDDPDVAPSDLVQTTDEEPDGTPSRETDDDRDQVQSDGAQPGRDGESPDGVVTDGEATPNEAEGSDDADADRTDVDAWGVSEPADGHSGGGRR
ncbi:Zn-dependent protease with chaperone function [Halomicrobium zhouii]|uniref:Zn-dependent protease with chaperone function n=1 Tax=Halomicrobium zhouii TaxID=767519 RepID=A0A1I6M7X8_9EURY|nr:hypothetical protein [Halomicrobium zhouii]SFS11733.1 Zn-dependent protease with chaperone function [Halomicrobium zhouii]